MVEIVKKMGWTYVSTVAAQVLTYHLSTWGIIFYYQNLEAVGFIILT
jgi:hypothetical protein